MSSSGLIALPLLTMLLPAALAAMPPASACVEAAAAAERTWKLPPDLVGAIGRVESGRLDAATGRVTPWPWTVNANGSGSYFATRTEAVAFVRALWSQGVRLIDVGCFQIDLFYHPAAFGSLEQAFDPAANADYAARFLTGLYAETGNWPAAIARYHSGLALEGETYRMKVMGQRRSGGTFVALKDPPADGPVSSPGPVPDRYVVLMSAAARAIRVFRP